MENMENGFDGPERANRHPAGFSVFFSCLGVFFLLWLMPAAAALEYDVAVISLAIAFGFAFIVAGLATGRHFLKACKLTRTGGLHFIVKMLVVLDVIAVVTGAVLIPANLTCKNFNFLSPGSGTPSCSVAIPGNIIVFMPYFIIHEMINDE
jgi:hypothetical protein